MSVSKLTPASGFNVNRMVFASPQLCTVPNTTPQLSYYRVDICTKYPDGTVGPLLLPTERLFSFGVSENTDPTTKKLNGYTLPLCLWNKTEVTEPEKVFSDKFSEICDHVKSHLLEIRDEVGKYDLDEAELKKFNPLYWKRDKGKIIPGIGPTLYPKLIVSKKNGDNKILTMFYDQNGSDINPMDLVGKYCHVEAVVKIESIYVGAKCSLQVKLQEAQVELLETGIPRLLQKRPTIKDRISESQSLHEILDEPDNNEDIVDEEVVVPEPVVEVPKTVKVISTKKTLKKT